MKKLLLLLISLCISTTLSHAQQGDIDFTLEDIDGKRHSLSEHLEKGPVYISFWALWCQPCLHKMRLLKPVYDDLKEQGFTLLLINIDTPNSMARVRAYVNAQQYTMPVLLDPNERVFEQFNGRSLPYAVLINQDGSIVQIDAGFLPGDEHKIRKKVESLLSHNP